MLKYLTLATTALMLVGCGRAVTYERTAPTNGYMVKFGPTEYAYINVWTDPVTGCESYVTDDGFMSPRLNQDGTQRCRTTS